MRMWGGEWGGDRQRMAGMAFGDVFGPDKITGPQAVPGPQLPRGIYEGGTLLSKISHVEKFPNRGQLLRELVVGEGVAE